MPGLHVENASGTAHDGGVPATHQARPPHSIVTPQVARYELVCEEWKLEAHQRPAAIALPASAAEMAEVAAFAKAWGLRIAEHGCFGTAPLDDAILLKPVA